MKNKVDLGYLRVTWTRFIGLVAALCCCWLGIGVAYAEDAGLPHVLVQARTRSLQPAEAQQVEALKNALRDRAYLVDARTLAARVDAGLLLFASDEVVLDDVTLSAQISKGILSYNQARIEDATRELTQVIRAYWRNPWAKESVRLIADAYLVLAVSQQKLGNEVEAHVIMQALLRDFSLSHAALTVYGPVVEAFYKKEERLASKQIGRLEIVKADPQTQVYVDGEFVTASDSGLILMQGVKVGVCHVLLRMPHMVGHLYEVEIRNGETTRLDERGTTDIAWHQDWVGWTLPADAALQSLGERTRAFAKRLQTSSEVAVVFTTQAAGLRQLAVGVFGAAGQLLRSYVIDPSLTPAHMVEVARFVAEGSAVKLPPPRAAVARAHAATSAPSHLGAKLLVAGGVGLVIAGGSLVAIDEDPVTVRNQEVPRTYRDSAMPGVLTASIGAVAIGVGVWWWLREPKAARSSAAAWHRSRPLVVLRDEQVVLGWAGSF